MPAIIGVAVVVVVVVVIVVLRRRGGGDGALDAFKDRQYEQQWFSTYAADLVRTMFVEFFLKDKTAGEAAIAHLEGCEDGQYRRAAYVVQSFWTFLAADAGRVEATELVFMNYLAKVEEHLYTESLRVDEDFRTRFVRKIPNNGAPPATPVRVEDDWGNPHRFGVFRGHMTRLLNEIHRTKLTTDEQIAEFERLRRATQRK